MYTKRERVEKEKERKREKKEAYICYLGEMVDTKPHPVSRSAGSALVSLYTNTLACHPSSCYLPCLNSIGNTDELYTLFLTFRE